MASGRFAEPASAQGLAKSQEPSSFTFSAPPAPDIKLNTWPALVTESAAAADATTSGKDEGDKKANGGSGFSLAASYSMLSDSYISSPQGSPRKSDGAGFGAGSASGLDYFGAREETKAVPESPKK